MHVFVYVPMYSVVRSRLLYIYIWVDLAPRRSKKQEVDIVVSSKTRDKNRTEGTYCVTNSVHCLNPHST